ncbi:MAG: glycosyltransferase family 4 protein [Cyanobacteria bacterium J06632_3]
MNILFLHPNFPAQFRHLAFALAQDSRHQVVFGTARREGAIPGVTKALYHATHKVGEDTHAYLRGLEDATRTGQAVYRMGQQLKADGFTPDVIFGHSGWGPTLFMKDLFPKAQLNCYFEWFYHAHGSDADFDPSEPMLADDEARLRMKNASILTDLYSCDRGLSPTHWQQQQFPKEFQSKISVMHDGIDTDFFRPKPGDKTSTKLVLPRIGLDLSETEEIITYVARGMEPYRGFPQFIEAAALLQKRRPNCHIVVVGEDRTAYGRRRPDGKTHKEWMLENTPLDLTRIHFTGRLAYPEYLQVIQASSVHVYLTRPFVLSWSFLEALSTGCAVVGSDTAPVREVIEEGENGLLVDFFSPDAIANRVEEILENPTLRNKLSANARQTILERYDLAKLLPHQIEWLTGEVPSLTQRHLELPQACKPLGFGTHSAAKTGKRKKLTKKSKTRFKAMRKSA